MVQTNSAPIKVLFYAINGTGLGHLSRLLAIARSARDLVRACGLRADFQFLTTSEASEVAWDFPVYKLPSKSVVAGSDSSRRSFSANAKLLISNLVAGFRPDVLVLDTVPEGSYREFLFLRDYAKRCAFIDRHKNRSHSTSDSHLSHLALYDLVLIPDHEKAARRYPSSQTVSRRRRFVGPIHGFDEHAASTRTEVREEFAAAPDERLVYVSAGGGGDARASRDLDTILDVLAEDPGNLAIVGYGPLFRGRKRYGRGVIPLAGTDAGTIFPGVDLAISAAGYNTYQELLAARVPTVFFAQQKGMDRQDERISHGLEKGWHGAVSSLEPTLLRAEIHRLTRPENTLAIREALAKRPTSQGRLRGAVEILRLHASLEHSPLDSRAIVSAALAHQAWSPAPHIPPEPISFVECFRNASIWRELTQSEFSRLLANDEDIAAWEGKSAPSRETTDLVDLGRRLAGYQQSTQMRDGEWRAFLKDFLADAPARGDAMIESRWRMLDACLDEVVRSQPEEQRAEFLRESREQWRSSDLAAGLQEWLAARSEEPRGDGPPSEERRAVGHANEE